MKDHSLVLLWAAPLYEGRGPVAGYSLEISRGERSDEWTAVNDEPVAGTHYKVRRYNRGTRRGDLPCSP